MVITPLTETHIFSGPAAVIVMMSCSHHLNVKGHCSWVSSGQMLITETVGSSKQELK